jgi:hypothetical protein
MIAIALIIGVWFAAGAEEPALTEESVVVTDEMITIQGKVFQAAPMLTGYLKTVYRNGASGVEDVGTTSNEFIPQEDGSYLHVTHTEERIGGTEGMLFAGASLLGADIMIAGDEFGEISLASLAYCLEDENLRPHQTILLPDGGTLQTLEAGIIAGIDVIHAVYTHIDNPNFRVTLSIPRELELRALLPSPPRLRLEVRSGPDEQFVMLASTELIEFVHEP